MNKIDLMVKGMMLRFPTLYPNRFDAFAEIMTNSCYEWDDTGNIVHIFPEEPATPEYMVAKMEKQLQKQKDNCAAHNCEALEDLHRSFIVEDEQKLHNARFVANNIDTFASSYCGVGYNTVWLFLWRLERHGVSTYGCINNPPEQIDEEWRKAIQGWISQLLPSVNSLFGMYQPEGFVPIPRYEAVFNWARKVQKKYETPLSLQQQGEMNRLAQEIIDEIKTEEAAKA